MTPHLQLGDFVCPDLGQISESSLNALENILSISVEEARSAWSPTEAWLEQEPLVNTVYGPLSRDALVHELSPYFMGNGCRPRAQQKSIFEREICRKFAGIAAEDVFDNCHDSQKFRSLVLSIAAELRLPREFRHVAVKTRADARGTSVIYPAHTTVIPQLEVLFGFVCKFHRDYRHLCAVAMAVGISHIHPLSDGNGRLSRLLYNWLAFQRVGIEFYLPVYECSLLSDGGYILRKRMARKARGWNPIVDYFVMLNGSFHTMGFLRQS